MSTTVHRDRPDHLLCHEPRFRPGDLGAPLPPASHANSACLPTWQDVVDYEEKRPRVIGRLRAGYPRFVVPPECARLFEQGRARLAREGEKCHVYPTRRSAERSAAYIRKWSGAEARVAPWPDASAWAVLYPAGADESALKYWRHTGDGISSRQAESLLNGTPEPDATAARRALRERIGRLAGANPEDVFLFKSGMAAIYALYRACVSRAPGRRCVQFGFPYVDTLKVLQDFGAPHAFFPMADASDLSRLAERAGREALAGVFCEFPSNPLLNSADLAALAELGAARRFPVIVDDTIASWANANVLPAADAVVTSLTKWFSGRGDVMGGSVVLNAARPLYPELRAALEAEFEDCAWGGSLIRLEEDSRDFVERTRRSSETAKTLCAWLRGRPEVKDVYFPLFRSRELYDRFRLPEGGYGGLFSIVLKDAPQSSAAFFDRLEFCKGPNLGTTFSLCCPFTLLAHFGELDWAEQCGVSRWLIRFSIGQEPADELIGRLERALVNERP